MSFAPPPAGATHSYSASADDERRFAAKQAEWEKATAKIRRQDGCHDRRPLVAGKYKKAHDRFQEELQALQRTSRAANASHRRTARILRGTPDGIRARAFRRTEIDQEGRGQKCYQELEQELKAFDSLKPAPLLKAPWRPTPDLPRRQIRSRPGVRRAADIQPGFRTARAGRTPVRPLPTSTGRRTALADRITRRTS